MRDKIKLVSSEGTGHYYTTTKNKRLHPEKMEVKKFDPVVRKHVMYKSQKLNNYLFFEIKKRRFKRLFCYPNIVSSGTFFSSSL